MQTTGQTNPPAAQTGTPGGQGAPAPGAPARARRVKPPIPEEFKAETIEKLDQAALLAILKEPGTAPADVFKKGIACKRLAVIGTKDAVPALAALLNDERVSDYARDALESIPDPAADETLRAALPKLKGLVLVGAINSLARRRDARAVDPLARLIHDADPAVARAAATGLGAIGIPTAAKALQDALGKTRGAIRAQVANGLLLCADRMMATDRKAAVALFEVLSRPDIPGTVRASAMHLQLAAETSLSRPRSAPGTVKN